MQERALAALLVAAVCITSACGDDEGTEADRLGVGAECSSSDDCADKTGDDKIELVCLKQFKAGYCGLEDCESNDDCPEASNCVAHTDGNRYCFRSCVDKAECNLNRSAGNESNCSSNVTYVDKDTSEKACVPPSD
jgi:hypothetical protein